MKGSLVQFRRRKKTTTNKMFLWVPSGINCLEQHLNERALTRGFSPATARRSARDRLPVTIHNGEFSDSRQRRRDQGYRKIHPTLGAV